MLETTIYHAGNFDALSKIEKANGSLSGGSNGHRFRHIAGPAKEIRFLLALPGQLMISGFGMGERLWRLAGGMTNMQLFDPETVPKCRYCLVWTRFEFPSQPCKIGPK